MLISNGKMRTRVALAASIIVVGIAATGCPSFSVEQIDLLDGSVSTEGFTLTATIVVTEEDPAVDDQGDLSGGRGILGVWLPPGWTADEARVRGPLDSDFSTLAPVADGEGHFPPTFPFTPGSWFAFASGCQNLAEGEFEYEVQLDVSGDGSSSEVIVGISSALFDDAGSQGPVPWEITVDLAGATLSVLDKPAAPASAGLDECASIPYEDAPADDGCSCDSVGTSGRSVSLLGIVTMLF